ncbi:GGDEF domain-containing protein [Pontibacterium sp. N1Y112]|uniref:diguanylate cyclase n=1 Tax=Pontibacterium sinense TaxID=2781979 RepID=A0A8J7K6M8_9GAMM|nr:GGDEF domain-containing protein [Pontibacterium sinense]
MISDQENWKQKYHALKKDFQATEKQRDKQDKVKQQHTDLVLQITRQLALNLQGFDAMLDGQLDDLFSALNTEETAPLKKVAKQLDKALRSSQNRKTRTADEILSAVRRWISELKSLTSQEQTLNALEVTRNLSQDSVHQYYEVPSVLSNILRLQSEIMDGLHEASQTNNIPAIDEDTQLVLHHIAGDLLELLDGLHLTSAHRQKADALIQQLEQGFSLDNLPGIMHKVVQLVSDCSRSLNDEFERYLLDISRQLADMQELLIRSHKAQQSNNLSQMQLNEEMQTEVDSIKVVTKRAASLNQLKQMVTSQVSRIQGAVDNIKATEQRRHQEAERRHQRLTAQLKTVEAEAQQTMARVEEERLRSRIDPLTKLPNRTAYNERIGQELEKFRTYERPLSVAVCDIDHFKKVNDTYGHLAGDKALRLLASVFIDSLRNSDFVARYGGEEFIILMPSTPCEEAARVLDKLRAAIAASPFNFKSVPVPITISMGVTEAGIADTAEELFSKADNLLYQAKKQGRNRLCADYASDNRVNDPLESSDLI